MKWMYHLGKSLDELLIMTYQDQKSWDFSIGVRWTKFIDSFQILLVGLNTLLG